MNFSNSTFGNTNFASSIFHAETTSWNILIYFLISVIGAIVHVLLLAAMFKDPLKCFHDATSRFIINMAVSDLLNLMITIEEFFLIRARYGGMYGLPKAGFAVNHSIYNLAAFSTYPSIFSLALERSLSVIFPLWHRVNVSPKVCYIWLTTLWLISAVYSGINYILEFEEQTKITKYMLMLPEGFFSLLTIVSYYISCVSIRKQQTVTRNNSSLSEIHRRSIEARLRIHNQFLFTIFIVNIGLFFALIPSVALVYYLDADRDTIDNPILAGVFYATDILLHINFASNPFIYIWRLQKYRRTFFAMFLKTSNRNRNI